MNIKQIKQMANRRSQKGITMIEYALIAAVVVVTIIGGYKFLAGSVNNKFQEVGSKIANP